MVKRRLAGRCGAGGSIDSSAALGMTMAALGMTRTGDGNLAHSASLRAGVAATAKRGGRRLLSGRVRVRFRVCSKLHTLRKSAGIRCSAFCGLAFYIVESVEMLTVGVV